jgi:adenylate cyclase
MNRRFLALPQGWVTLGILGVFLLAQTFAFTRGIRRGTLSTLLLAGGWTWICTWAFAKGMVLPFARPVVFLLLSGIVEGTRQYRATEKDRRRIREVFGRYVNDSVIQEILNRPRDEFMAGNRKLLCVMFSDIRGFTSFSESRDPTEVVRFLNTYFEGLTEIILRHDGVVDKFLGDGLMAFFNAPLEKESFVHDAVSAAYEMRKFVESDAIRKAAGSFDLKVGIALNVGYTVVGNIGSERKTEFTAIGDTVNTTSRMESLNKDFGTDIIASESVVEKTGSDFEWKFLAQQSIRGKEHSVKLYALVGKKAETPPTEVGGVNK